MELSFFFGLDVVEKDMQNYNPLHSSPVRLL